MHLFLVAMQLATSSFLLLSSNALVTSSDALVTSSNHMSNCHVFSLVVKEIPLHAPDEVMFSSVQHRRSFIFSLHDFASSCPAPNVTLPAGVLLEPWKVVGGFWMYDTLSLSLSLVWFSNFLFNFNAMEHTIWLEMS